MLNSTFRNVTAEGSMLHWGVFGTNLNKDFRLEKCQLNRVDVHFHCWNLTIWTPRSAIELYRLPVGEILLSKIRRAKAVPLSIFDRTSVANGKEMCTSTIVG